MPKIVWDQTFSVNNTEIDLQHKKWIEIMNDLHNALMGDDIKKIEEIALITLKQMQEYIHTHFSYEENYMREIRYPENDSHALLHKEFIEHVASLCRDMKSGKVVLNTEIMSALKQWLRDHILQEDKKYCEFAAKEC